MCCHWISSSHSPRPMSNAASPYKRSLILPLLAPPWGPLSPTEMLLQWVERSTQLSRKLGVGGLAVASSPTLGRSLPL
ncbi:unnamed protein product, partial [Gulo gulo]